jgi:predicted Fe-Mo cluster-binding NifX family protein
MKLMIATSGKTLEDIVARKFGHAKYFLEVDPETMAYGAVENPGHTGKQELFQKAAADGVAAIITGNIGPRGFALLNAHSMEVAFAAGIPVREAVTKYLRGELKILDAPTIANALEERDVARKQKRLEHNKRLSAKGPGFSKGATPRGRHHLQQLGGRGH